MDYLSKFYDFICKLHSFLNSVSFSLVWKELRKTLSFTVPDSYIKLVFIKWKSVVSSPLHKAVSYWDSWFLTFLTDLDSRSCGSLVNLEIVQWLNVSWLNLYLLFFFNMFTLCSHTFANLSPFVAGERVKAVLAYHLQIK
jgi:hypothetical protein